ncbi:HlyC/CorC family transporter [Alcanivorax quisquiliarum]|uniref:Magnesium and cobalt efflux protein CorC n=1 Tax=Alcanivorax quisquiliarum TaxID=2933565 RepID=A0ABT0E631_9GAMM|nr:transporter associated domain-containing protein [Alcanivorax quisquiliarum]MCK0537290.1 CBS domain-containing protein [Alcanivorax quisquiliarum]
MPEEHADSGNPGRSWLERITQFFSAEPTSREDLLGLIRSLRGRDVLDADTLGILEGALEVSNLQVREIMVPRAQMISIRANSHPREFLPVVIECAHSRFPVLGDDPDEVLGVLLAKDLLPLVLDPARMERFSIKDHIRPAFIIPESKRLDSLLRDFRDNHNHMAIVVNEYGGVAGLVTIEDVLEQIVGDIEDETDVADDDYLIRELEHDEYTVQALIPIEDFNDHFGSQFSDDEFDTIGGLVMQQFGRLPERDESVTIGDFSFTVLSADARTIRLLRVTPPRALKN